MSDHGPAANARGRWWVIHEAEILRALRDVATGTNPDVALMELTANTKPGDDADPAGA